MPARSHNNEGCVPSDGFARDGIRYVPLPNDYLVLVEISVIRTKPKARVQDSLTRVTARVSVNVQNFQRRANQLRERRSVIQHSRRHGTEIDGGDDWTGSHSFTRLKATRVPTDASNSGAIRAFLRS